MAVVEIACNSYTSCLNAVHGAAHRIELFENLVDGGCTPSAGMIRKAASLPIPVYAMIRPRGGDFVYNYDEIEIMLHDIEFCKQIGISGIVLGCLQANGEVDIETNTMLLRSWNGAATFHRAIDRTNDIMEATKRVADMGFERILSSGGAGHVMNGLETLKRMQNEFGTSIRIQAGAGVNAKNARTILEYTGCKDIHATCKKTISVSVPNASNAFDDTITYSDVDEIKSLVSAVKDL